MLLGTRSRFFYDDGADRARFIRDGLSRAGGATLRGTYGLADGVNVSTTLSVLAYYAGSLFTAGMSFSTSGFGSSGQTARVPTPRGGSCCTIQ